MNDTGSFQTHTELYDEVEEYFFDRHSRLALVRFQGRFSALLWLRRRLTESLAQGRQEVEEAKASGAHYVSIDHPWSDPGVEDDMLSDFGSMLKTEAQPITMGALILSATSLVEALMTELLAEPNDTKTHRAGLRAKAEALIQRWTGIMDADAVHCDIEWLAARRNSFAHRFLDEVDPFSHAAKADFKFDAAAVEEAFTRVGALAEELAEGWEYHCRSSEDDNRVKSPFRLPILRHVPENPPDETQ